jgi:diacylglycerol kinase family enzyme
MRLLLIANVTAQQVTPWRVTVIQSALASAFDLDVALTKRGGHATHLARGAAHEGVDLVVALGGDGTVNEVANGLAGTSVPMGILPGGGVNVLARSLGIPIDPIEATAHLLRNRGNPPRRVTLGRAEDRYFTFSCGVGLDGAIVQQVERRKTLKKAGRTGYYAWTALRVFFARYGRRRPKVHVRWGPELEHGRDGLFVAIAQNADPYTYLGPRPMRLCPKADFDGGLDLMALDSLGVGLVLRVIASAFGSGRHTRSRHVLYLHDQPRIEVTCDEPLPVQADGEYMGDRDRVILEAAPEALSLLY